VVKVVKDLKVINGPKMVEEVINQSKTANSRLGIVYLEGSIIVELYRKEDLRQFIP